MMEVTPHLKSVLKNYQHSATKSLQGPGLALVAPKSEPSSPDAPEEEYVPAAPFPVQQLPILTTPDTSSSERSETVLEGETIACFVVGGEKRLCLPQVLNSVLRDFTWQQINQECDQLQIYCSRCTPEQLNLLKNGGILPSGAASSGLITKTDAERLCSALMHGQHHGGGHHHHRHRKLSGSVSFAVYHKCFGKCRGVCYPELYTSKNAKCIECAECQAAFSPQQFVCHVHRQFSENRTVHWGFDSANWRAYIKVAKDQSDQEQCRKYLDEIKEQYDGKIAFALPPNIYAGIKRKQVLASEIIKDHDLPLKKQKLLAEYLNPPVSQYPSLYGVYLQQYMQDVATRHLSAFKPVLHNNNNNNNINNNSKEAKIYNLMTINANTNRYSDPPILQNPERVVPISESERFERSYQPNVALAPPTPKKHRYGKTFIKQEVEIKQEEEVVVKQEPVEVIQAVPVVVPRYNPEIELSTDTEDSASETSNDRPKIEEMLKGVEVGIRDRILEAFRTLAKEKERWMKESRKKDEKIKELEKKLADREGAEEVCSPSTTTTTTTISNHLNNNNNVNGNGKQEVVEEDEEIVEKEKEEIEEEKSTKKDGQQTSVIASAVAAAEPKAIINTAPE